VASVCAKGGSGTREGADVLSQAASPMRTVIRLHPCGGAQERVAELDGQGFGQSPRGCRSFGEAAVDLFLERHRFQHVFRVGARGPIHVRFPSESPCSSRKYRWNAMLLEFLPAFWHII
jgi:hypothetical protein